MNCEELRDNLFEYLDGSLAPANKAAVEKHLAGCRACREAVQRESRLERSLSRGLEQAVAPVTLDPVARHGLVAALERELAEPRERPRPWFWRWPAWPFASAAMILMGVGWLGHHFLAGQNLPSKTPPTLAHSREIPVHVTCAMPGYTFRKDGNLVLDALTSDTLAMDGVVLVANPKPKTEQDRL